MSATRPPVWGQPAVLEEASRRASRSSPSCARAGQIEATSQKPRQEENKPTWKRRCLWQSPALTYPMPLLLLMQNVPSQLIPIPTVRRKPMEQPHLQSRHFRDASTVWRMEQQKHSQYMSCSRKWYAMRAGRARTPTPGSRRQGLTLPCGRRMTVREAPLMSTDVMKGPT